MRATGLCAALLLLACGGDSANTIDGSLTASYEMDFDHVRARRFTEEVSVEYYRDELNDPIVLKIAVSFVEHDIRTGVAIPLRREQINRTLEGADFPEFCEGEDAELRPSQVTFDEYGETEGSAIEGSWRMCFANGLDGIGTFAAELEVIE